METKEFQSSEPTKLSSALVKLKVLSRLDPFRPREKRIGEVFCTVPHAQLEVSALEKQIQELDCLAVVLFLASDVGCVANQGKPAAAHGPKTIREVLFSMQQHSSESEYFDSSIHVDASRLLLLEADLFDVQLQSVTLDATKPEQNAELCEMVETLGKRARVMIGALLRASASSSLKLIIGGGDNYGYDCIREIFTHEQNHAVIVVNFDPHADVRDPICPTSTEESPSIEALSGHAFARHSGNWVSQAMSEGMVEAYIPVGLDPLRNNSWTMQFLKHHSVDWQPFRKPLLNTQLSSCLDRLVSLIQSYDASVPIYLNFDADSVKGVHVSATNPDGLDPQQAYECIRMLLSKFTSRIKLVRLAEIGGCSTSPLQHATGVFGANFITTCIAASGVQTSSQSATSESAAKKQKRDV